MLRAARVGWACLFSIVISGCVQQRAPRPSVPTPPPAALPEGQQSLEDLDRALRNGGPALVASLERSAHTGQKWAAVKVTVAGIGLVDPQMVGEDPQFGQGHLHYQIDGGPVIATTATKLSFHDLAPGRHTVVVLLAGNDHRPLGPKRILTVNIPSDAKPQRSKARKPAMKRAPAMTDDAISAR